MSERFDAIVIGGGQNGLAAAARLARAGRRTVLLERAAALGGLCAQHPIAPGYALPGIHHDGGLISSALAARLGLVRHGLAFRAAPPVLLGEPAGPGLLLPREEGGDGELAARSRADAVAYAAFRDFAARLAPALAGLLGAPPPPLAPAGAGERWEIARAAWRAWRLGRRERAELLRVAPMCVADFLAERFATPLVVEGLAAPAVVGTWAGPWSAGTTANLLLAEANEGRFLAGGPAALVAALERAAREAGAELRTSAEVVRLRLAEGGVAGVELAGGAALDAPLVVATCDPKRALLDLLPPGALPLAVEDEVRHLRTRGAAAKIHLALDGPFELAGRPGARIEALRLGGGHVDALERAFDAVKYRRVSERPFLDVRVPSVGDPTLAPAGHDVLSILVAYAPYELDGGWTPARRAALGDRVVALLEEVAPGVTARVVAREVLAPPDLEARFAVTGGQLAHVEPALDQLWLLRPTAATARYTTPVAGLLLGGSGSHGGGGVHPGAGLLAAERALATTSRTGARR